MRWILLTLGLGVFAPGCGDDAPTTGDATGTSATTSAPPGTTDASTITGSTGSGSTGRTTMDATGTTTAGQDTTETTSNATTDATGDASGGTTDGTSGGSGASTGSTGTTTGGMALYEGSIASLMLFQDCKPIVSPDPVGANFVLSLTNNDVVPVSASVTEVRLVDAFGVQAATIEVMPNMIGPIAAGVTSMTPMTKVPDSIMPTNGCMVITCGGSYTLEVVLDVDGTEVIAADVGLVGCAF